MSAVMWAVLGALVMLNATHLLRGWERRGEKQVNHTESLATITSNIASIFARLTTVETAQKEHGEIAIAVTRLQAEQAGLVRDIANMRDDFRRALDEFIRPRRRVEAEPHGI